MASLRSTTPGASRSTRASSRAQRQLLAPAMTVRSIRTVHSRRGADPVAVWPFGDSASATASLTRPAVATVAPSSAPPTELTTEEIVGLFELWNSRLAEGDPKKMAELYAPSAVLLATLSNEPRTTHEAIADYFTTFLERKPQGTLVEKHVRVLHDPTGLIAINSGVYIFNFGADGTSATARYSFLYRFIEGEWKIVYHHSSLLPETLEDQIVNTFAKWNNALQTGKPETVAALYAPDAVLLPTVSNVVRSDPDAIKDYFVAFLKRKPVGKVDVGYVLDLGYNLAAYAGIYTFNFGDGSGMAQARFSFKYRKELTGEWLIIDHHSSVLPENKPYIGAATPITTTVSM